MHVKPDIRISTCPHGRPIGGRSKRRGRAVFSKDAVTTSSPQLYSSSSPAYPVDVDMAHRSAMGDSSILLFDLHIQEFAELGVI